MKDFLTPLVVVLAAILIGASAEISLLEHLYSKSCYARWADSGYEVSYGFHSGCRIKVGEHYFPERMLRKVSP